MNFLDKTGLQYFWGKIKTQINNSFAANDAMTFKGTIGTRGTVTALPATHKVGDTYKVSTAGTYAGAKCEIGDMIICVKDGSSDTASDWTIVQSNIDGAVTGPTSSTDAHVAVFNGSTGKIIKDSGFTIAKSVPSNAVFTDTTYSVATTSKDGLMSAADKKKLEGITGNGDYVLPAATSTTLGGVKIGSNITNSSGTISITKQNVTNALGYTPLQTASDTKVTQNTPVSTSGDFNMLMAKTAGNVSNETSDVNKARAFTYNPGTQCVKVSRSDGEQNTDTVVLSSQNDYELKLSPAGIIMNNGDTPRLTIDSDGGTFDSEFTITAVKFVKSGGTSSQLLIADGSVATAISNRDIDAICVD